MTVMNGDSRMGELAYAELEEGGGQAMNGEFDGGEHGE